MRDVVLEDLRADFPDATEEQLSAAADIVERSLLEAIERGWASLGAALAAGRKTRLG